MILEFGAVNFFSFREGFEVNLRLADKNSDGKGYTNILGIKGANASGKTNVVKLLSFMSFLVKHSFSELKPDDTILVSSHFNNQEPISMFIIFIEDGIEYKYELELTRKEIIRETLYKKKERLSKIIDRHGNNITYAAKEYKELTSMKLRSNASLISTAKQYELKSIDTIYKLFTKIITNVTAFGRTDTIIKDYKEATKLYQSHPGLFKFAVNILKSSDTGIDDIEIKKNDKGESGRTYYYPIFKHKIGDGLKNLTYHYQSGGTKSLYIQLAIYKIALLEGSTLALDEFDVNLHPDLLPKLIDLFETQNKNDAQLIFTSHNNEIMDKLGKYRTVLVNKENNESFLYRLDEIPGDILRNDRPITPIYASGKIGGKPRLTYGE